MSVACAQCGIVTNAPELLPPARGGGLCPPCFERRERAEARRLGRLVLLAGLAGLALVAANAPLGWLVINLGLGLPAALFVSVAVHEAGHVLAARLTGQTVYGLRLGHGPLLWRGGSLELRALPVSGHSTFGCTNGVWLGARWQVVLAAGPLANLLLLAATRPYLHGSLLGQLTAGPAPALLLAAASALSLLLSVLPVGGQQGDGRQFLAALRHDDAWVHERMAAGWVLHLRAVGEAGLGTTALHQSRQSPTVRRCVAELAIERGKWAEALRHLVLLPDFDWADRLDLARCLAEMGEHLPRAARLCAVALADVPWDEDARALAARLQAAISGDPQP